MKVHDHTEHHDVEALIPAYAIGALDSEEARQVEAHLARCATCRALLAQYNQLAEDMLYAVPPVPVPDQVEAALRRELDTSPEKPAARPRAAFPFPRLAAYLAAAAVLLLFLGNGVLLHRVNRLEAEARAQATALAVLARAPAVVLRGDAPAPAAEGVLYLQPDTNLALLHVRNLPPVPEGKAYQVWLIHNGKRDSGGLFHVDEKGEAVLLIRAPRPLAEYQAIGVTVEPAGGSPGPTSPRVIGGKF